MSGPALGPEMGLGMIPGRDMARDLLRGVAVFEMEIANHISDLLHTPPGVNAYTYADTVFPTFVYAAGLGPKSHHHRRRCVTLVGLGLVYNWIRDPDHRILPKRGWGVLQRLGIAQGLLSLDGLLHDKFPRAPKWSFPAACLALWSSATYGLASTRSTPFRPPESTAEARLSGGQFDPEGILGTLMTAASMWFAQWSSTTLTANEAVVTGFSLVSGGYMIAYAFPRVMPINKPFWTPSYALFTSGLSLLKYQAAKLFIKYLWPMQPLKVVTFLGQNSLAMFMGSALLDLLPARSWIQKRVSRAIKSPLMSELLTTSLCTGLVAAVVAVLRSDISIQINSSWGSI